MQFREQGKKIQCIRSIYDHANKRNYQKVVATFFRWESELSLDDLTVLTEAERREFTAWFYVREAEKAERLTHENVKCAVSNLVHLKDAIMTKGAEMADDEAGAIWSALADVAKALRKVGHPKPKRVSRFFTFPEQADFCDAAVRSADGFRLLHPLMYDSFFGVISVRSKPCFR